MSTIEQAREFSKALRIRSAYGSEARQAADTIDALIAELASVTTSSNEWESMYREVCAKADAELAALKGQEPVAWRYKAVSPFKDSNGMCNVSETWSLLSTPGQIDAHSSVCGMKAEPLYRVAGAQPIPAGYQLVPVEPTPEMLQAILAYKNKSLHGAYKAMLAAAPVQAQEQRNPETCQWTPMDADETGSWESACGEAWSFIDGGPVENNVRFCHGCGKAVEVTR